MSSQLFSFKLLTQLVCTEVKKVTGLKAIRLMYTDIHAAVLEHVNSNLRNSPIVTTYEDDRD